MSHVLLPVEGGTQSHVDEFPLVHTHEEKHFHSQHDKHSHDHKDGCSHSHSHSGWRSFLPHAHSLESRLHSDTRSLVIAFFTLATAFSLQIVGSLIAGSSVLAVEAVHSALDGLTVIISLISVFVAARPATPKFTYGFSRAELLSALVSVIALGLLCVKLFLGATERLYHIMRGSLAPIHVEGNVVFFAEGITLVANIFMAFVLARGSSLNIRALRAHVIADSIENLVVIAAGALMWAFPQVGIIDPILTIVIVGVIVTMNIGIVGETVSALMQAAPGGIDVGQVGARIEKIDGVVGVGRVHVWTLTSGCSIGSAEVFVNEGSNFEEAETIREEVRHIFEELDCSQVTVQVSLKRVDEEGPIDCEHADGDDLVYVSDA